MKIKLFKDNIKYIIKYVKLFIIKQNIIVYLNLIFRNKYKRVIYTGINNINLTPGKFKLYWAILKRRIVNY